MGTSNESMYRILRKRFRCKRCRFCNGRPSTLLISASKKMTISMAEQECRTTTTSTWSASCTEVCAMTIRSTGLQSGSVPSHQYQLQAHPRRPHRHRQEEHGRARGDGATLGLKAYELENRLTEAYRDLIPKDTHKHILPWLCKRINAELLVEEENNGADEPKTDEEESWQELYRRPGRVRLREAVLHLD